MKHRLLISALLSLFALNVSAQNNPYGIDDTCHEYFRMAESLVVDTSNDAFDFANDALLKRAQEVGDEKARTLHYVCKLKRTIRFAREMKDREAGNEMVENQKKETVAISLETGYLQYLYYAYSLCQTYYANTKQVVHALALLNEMMDFALKNEDEYGIWQSHTYVAALYYHQNDVLNARKHLQQAVRLYENSTDETLRRQSITRNCCDLADTYTADSDSSRFYCRYAEEASKTHQDTLRWMYYKARFSAIDKDMATYCHYRDICLSDSEFVPMITTADWLFSSTDAILQGAPKDSVVARVSKVKVRQQLLYLRDLAIAYRREDVAAWMGSKIIWTFYSDIYELNNMKMEELSSSVHQRQLSLALQRQKRISRMLWLIVGVLVAALLAALSSLYLRKQKSKDNDTALRPGS